MAKAEKLYKDYFLEYASYVIRDRAIPDLLDGFKPVQRRIIHTLLKIDDGRYNKVATVVGETMKCHPHGDASIGEALVHIENDGLFIEGQGNFGNILTGDSAAAGRYIECRLKPFAKKVLYSPEITEYVDTYDGRNKEPVVFQAKVPVVAITGTSGIAVGMTTKILPHNILEVLECQKKALRGEEFEIYPDFPTAGIVDVSQYDDGRGFVSVRAKINASDPKKVVIEELPYEVTSAQLIESIKKADSKGQLKISSITDYTAEKANIEITWQRGVYSEDMVDVLYATTDCQKKISLNPLVIDNGLPRSMGISEMIKFHARHLVKVLTAELDIEISHLEDKLRARTLERIFIEERIYKKIENKDTQEKVYKAVRDGFKDFTSELGGKPVTDEDIETLLKIQIRRISLFDIEKNKEEIRTINASIDDCNYKKEHIIEYAENYLTELEGMFPSEEFGRKTTIGTIEKKTAKDVAVRNLDVRYDIETGYLGTAVKAGESLLKVSSFDKIFYLKNNGEYRVVSTTDKIFIGKEGISFITYGEKDIVSSEIFTIIYRDKAVGEGKVWMIKRFQIPSFILDKTYQTVPETAKIKKICRYKSAIIAVKYKGKYRITEETFRFADFRVLKNPTGGGNRLTTKELEKLTIKETKDTKTTFESEPMLFNPDGDNNAE